MEPQSLTCRACGASGPPDPAIWRRDSGNATGLRNLHRNGLCRATPAPVATATTPPAPVVSTPTQPVVANYDRPSLTLVVSDVHYGNRWRPLWSGFLAFLGEWGDAFDRVVSNGDWFDFESVNMHPGGPPRPPTLMEDLGDGIGGLRELARLTPNAAHVFNEGNHDRWPVRFVASRAPTLDGLVDLPARVREAGWTFVDGGGQRRVVYDGCWRPVHGDQIQGTGGVSPAKTALDQGLAEPGAPGMMTLVGHFHRHTEHWRRWTTRWAHAVSLPTMIAPDPGYMKNAVAPWAFGFTIVEAFAGHSRVEVVTADIEGRFLYRGRVYGGP